ncbi:MAG: pyruvate kinase [Thermoproteota archaeon]
MRKAKVIATLGPSTTSYETTKEVAKYVDGFRINFSHATEEERTIYIKNIRRAENELNKPLAVIGDLQGPSIRFGKIKEKSFKVDDQFYISLNGEVPLSSEVFFNDVSEKDLLLIDDGKVQLKVLRKYDDRIEVKALSDGCLTPGKAIVIKGKEYSLPAISPKDEQDIKWCIDNEVDYIAMSYVKKKSDVVALRRFLEENGGSSIKVMCKIETNAGFKNLKEILEECDMVIVARGDLGLHFSIEEIPFLQSKIIEESLRNGKQAIVATQLLTSMVESVVPTRSEAVDVYNAIKEGTSGFLLTNETSIGKHPVETVMFLNKIILLAEKELVNLNIFEAKPQSLSDKFSYGLVKLSEALESTIVIYTKSGNTAFRIAKFRPKIRVYSSSANKRVVRQINLLWNFEPFLVEEKDYENGLENAISLLVKRNKLKPGDSVILTYGLADRPHHIIRLIRLQ